MKYIESINLEVYVTREKICNISRAEINFLKGKVNQTERKRIRLCTHKHLEDKLHEMFIVLSRETYIRPHKHVNRIESLHVIEGKARAVFFDEIGGIIQVVPLGDLNSESQFYCRIDEAIYHTILVDSEYFVFHESVEGPFCKSNTIFSSWSPDESDCMSTQEYICNLSRAVHLLK